MLTILYSITGGRPMRKAGFAYTNVVSGRPVYYWRDRFGRPWMAEHAWSWFRVRAGNEVALNEGWE